MQNNYYNGDTKTMKKLQIQAAMTFLQKKNPQRGGVSSEQNDQNKGLAVTSNTLFSWCRAVSEIKALGTKVRTVL